MHNCVSVMRRDAALLITRGTTVYCFLCEDLMKHSPLVSFNKI